MAWSGLSPPAWIELTGRRVDLLRPAACPLMGRDVIAVGNHTRVRIVLPLVRVTFQQLGRHSLLQYFSKTGVDSGGTEWTPEDKIGWRKPRDVST